jgi:subtilisin family serine protease
MKLLPVAAALTLVAAAPAAAQGVDPTQGVRIAVIDSGINAAHQEFAPDQVVGYWDFTTSLPKDGQTFDPNHPPADGNGHGTLTAAAAAGLNVDPRKTPSFAPGFKLAIADVGTDDGTNSGDIAAAIRWSVRTMHADVINISIGWYTPIPGAPLLMAEYIALKEARDAGVLVTVANGNGTGNTLLVPGDGASSPYASSQDVLAVGASGLDGARVSYQPEVAASIGTTGPAHDSTDQYVTEGGTSFASPLVAGFAARLIAEARSAGRNLRQPELEELVKSAARDTEMPPPFEGYGVIDKAQLSAALAAARTGTRVARPDPDPSATYVERVANGERGLNAGELPPAG